MDQDEIELLIEKYDVAIEKGCVYNIFDCCIAPQKGSSTPISIIINGKPTTRSGCRKHKGFFLTKFKICDNCGSYVIGVCLKNGKTCTTCRKAAYKKKISEHKRGLYCKHYDVEEQGCFMCDNCWYCDYFDPIFKGTGPKTRIR